MGGHSEQDVRGGGSTERIRELLKDDPRLIERVMDCETEWKGVIFEVQKLKVATPDGGDGRRDILLHHGGAGVCAVRDGKICLVRQYRVALGRMTLEIPAGKLDPGEGSAAACAARELREETGLAADALEFVASSLGAPGFSNEKTRVFRAWGLHRGEACPDEGEFVSVVWLPVSDMLQGIREGLIQDAKTIVAVYDAALRPERPPVLNPVQPD